MCLTGVGTHVRLSGLHLFCKANVRFMGIGVLGGVGQHSIIFRVAAWRALVLGGAMAVLVGTVAWRVSVERGLSDRNHLRQLAGVVGRAIEPRGASVSLDERRALFKRVAWSAWKDPAVDAVFFVSPEERVLGAIPADRFAGDSGMDWPTLAERVGCAGRIASFRDEAGFRVVLLADSSGQRLRSLSVGAFVVIGLGGLALWAGSVLVFRRTMVVPLEELVCAARMGDGARSPSPVDRPDEIGAIARAIEELKDQHEDAHARINRMRRTAEQDVSDRTRQVQGMLRRAERKAWVDALTRLGNRALLEDRLEDVFQTQLDVGEDLSIIVLDLDNFKLLNDTLGHQAGDEILIFVGELLRGSLRPTDIGLRLGGDEFVIMLLGTESAEAEETADRLIKLFRQRALLLDVAKPVTLSAGLASLHRVHPESGRELLELADVALYEAKRAGKGCVKTHAHRTRKSLSC